MKKQRKLAINIIGKTIIYLRKKQNETTKWRWYKMAMQKKNWITIKNNTEGTIQYTNVQNIINRAEKETLEAVKFRRRKKYLKISD